MSHNMMTKSEFDAKYRDKCSEELSLEKWKRLDLRFLIESDLLTRIIYISAYVCGHCRKHYYNCITCGLNMGLEYGCSNPEHVWRKFKDALHNENLAKACDYQFQMIKLIEDDILKNQ